MNNYFKLIMAVMFSILVIGCMTPKATPRMTHSMPVDTVITPDKDKALVYFIRPDDLGFGTYASVHDGEDFIGFVPYGQKLPYLAEPGEHLFMVISEAADFMKADLLPGKTYYVQVMPRPGAWRARFSLTPITKEQLATDEVRNWIKGARLIKNRRTAYRWATDNHPSVLKKKTVYLEKWQSKDEDERPFLKASDGE